MHSIRADNAMSDLSVSSKLHSDWEFLQMLRDRGRVYAADWLNENFKIVLMHSIRADTAMSDLSVTSKLYSDWEFLQMLRDRGRTYATDWLNENFKHLNNRSSVDLEKEFL
jgi:hypothetical protein